MSLTGFNVAIWGDSAPHVLAVPLAAAGARVLLLLPSGAVGGRAIGGGPESFAAASGQPADLEKLAASVWGAAGRVSGLVVQPAFAIEEAAKPATAAPLALAETSWHAALESALKIPFFLARAFARRMENAGGGRIVVVAAAATTPSAALLAPVVREGMITMAFALAKALPSSVCVHAVVAPVGSAATSGVAESTCFLLAEPALPSGTIIRLDHRRE